MHVDGRGFPDHGIDIRHSDKELRLPIRQGMGDRQLIQIA